MGGWRWSAMRSDCVNLRGENKRHCRLEGLIGSAVSVQALLSADARAEHDHGGRQRECHDVSQENGWGLHARGTVAIGRMVPPQWGQMAKSVVSGRSPLLRLPAGAQAPVLRLSSSR